MAVGATGSVTERLERMGLEANTRDYNRQVRDSFAQPDPFSRAVRRVSNSVREKPVTWSLVSLGVGIAIGAAWFVANRDWR